MMNTNEPTIRENGGFWYVDEIIGGAYGRGGDIGTSAAQRTTLFQTHIEASYYVTIQSMRRELELSRETFDSLRLSVKDLVTPSRRVRTKKVLALVDWAERFNKPEEPASPSTAIDLISPF